MGNFDGWAKKNWIDIFIRGAHSGSLVFKLLFAGLPRTTENLEACMGEYGVGKKLAIIIDC